jgi:AraC-like DNA-binding protein
MVIAAFLPNDSAQRVRSLLPRHDVRLAGSCREFESLLRDGARIALIDPTAGVTNGLSELTAVWLRHPNATLVAYVIPSPANLKAVFRMSRLGLSHVFVHNDLRTEAQMLSTIESLAGHHLAVDLLAAVETKLKTLPLAVHQAVIDLFEHPKRYDTGQDLARQAGVTTKQLYRDFTKAGLRPPKQLVLLAKTIHAYGYLHFGNLPSRLAQKKVGYRSADRFSRHTYSIVGCQPADLRGAINTDELLLRLIEWMFKPYHVREALNHNN